MYNAMFKTAAASVAAILMLASCSSESESARAARQLYEQAQALNLDARPGEALSILDSLKNAYPAETEWQRAAMKLRPTVIINDSEQRIAAVDDSIAMLEQRYNSLLPKMKRITDRRLVEPYYVDATTYNAEFMKTTGIQPRVSDIGQLYFVSSVNPGGLKHTGFSLSADGETVNVGPVPYDGELNYRINGSEVITYSADQSEPAGAFAEAMEGRQVTLTLTGGKSKSMKLNAKQVQAIANCYEFSRSIIDARQLAFEKERLTRQLEIARSQAERLAQSED